MRERPSPAPILIVLTVIGAAAFWWLRSSDDPPIVDADDPANGAQAAGARPGDTYEGPRPGGAIDPRGALRAAIAGTIRDEEGQPIAGARVCASASARSRLLPSADTREARCTASEADGAYRIDGLFGVGHSVSASAPTYIAATYRRGSGARQRGGVDLQPGMEARDIDITLRGGGVEIHGVVKDLSGGPIEGAQVAGSHAIGFTDAEGAFSLWVAPGDAWLRATADGYAEGNDRGVAPGHTFQIFLTPEAVLQGKVVRAGDGGPVEGATVTAEGSGFGWNDSSSITDAAGRFRLGGLEPGAYKAMVVGDDVYGKADAQVILGLGETSELVVVTAHPAFSIKGSVVVAGGDVCEQGSVNVQDQANDRGTWAEIEADGAVHLRGLLPGEFKVDVRCGGHVSAERYERVTIADRSVDGVRWEVSPGQAIRGRVVDSRGQPVAEMNVSARPKLDPSQARAHATNAWSGRSDPDGSFELAGLLPGDYEITLRAWTQPRATPKDPTPVTVAEGRDVDGLTITLPPTGEIRGKVVDGDGNPVARASINLSGGADWRSANAADDGTFVLADVAPGSYRAVARLGFGDALRAPGKGDDDIQGERVTVEEGEVATVDLVVEAATGVIRGVVQDEDGGPVADAFIEASRESERSGAASGGAARSGRWSSIFGGREPILSDQDGRFTITQLSPGKHTILAHRKGGGEAILEHAELGQDVVLTIAATGTLAGTVTLAGGGAPESMEVSLRDEATGFSRSDSFFRSGGTFSLAEIPAGTYKITASAGGGTAEIEATMKAGEDLSDLRIELAPKVTARGTIVDEDGQPLAGMVIGISGGNSWRMGGDDDKRNITDEAGRFEITQAPTGRVQIMVSSRVSDDYEWTRVPLVITPGAAEVELEPIQVLRRRTARGETSGDLGYSVKDPAPGEDPLERRFVVTFIRPGGPAAKAGLKVGDEIISVDGKDIRGGKSYLFNALGRVPPGTTLILGLARGASVQVTAGERP